MCVGVFYLHILNQHPIPVVDANLNVPITVCRLSAGYFCLRSEEPRNEEKTLKRVIMTEPTDLY